MVGQEFPEFKMATCDADNTLGTITHETIDSEWTIMYFYPKDFTFICPTEIAAFDQMSSAAQVIGVSGDNEFCKLAWKQVKKMVFIIEQPIL